jgi:hypothetical protein
MEGSDRMKYQIYYCTNSSGSTTYVLAGCEDAAKDILIKTEFFRYTSDCGISHRCSIVESKGDYRFSDLCDQINAGQINSPEQGWPDAMVFLDRPWFVKDYLSPIRLRNPDIGLLEFYVIPPYDEYQKIVEVLKASRLETERLQRKISETDKFRISLKDFLEA